MLSDTQELKELVNSTLEKLDTFSLEIGSLDKEKCEDLVEKVREVRRLRDFADTFSGADEAKKAAAEISKEVKKVHDVASMIETIYKKDIKRFIEETGIKIKNVQLKDHGSWEVIDFDEVSDEFKLTCDACGGHGKIVDKKGIAEIVKILGQDAMIPGIASTKTKIMVIKND